MKKYNTLSRGELILANSDFLKEQAGDDWWVFFTADDIEMIRQLSKKIDKPFQRIIIPKDVRVNQVSGKLMDYSEHPNPYVIKFHYYRLYNLCFGRDYQPIYVKCKNVYDVDYLSGELKNIAPLHVKIKRFFFG